MIFVGFSSIMVRSLQISPRSRRDLEFHERHGEISTISARSRQSRRVLGNLGEMEHISPRSRRDLESNKNHGQISARSHQSRRDLANLGEISVKILHGLLCYENDNMFTNGWAVLWCHDCSIKLYRVVIMTNQNQSAGNWTFEPMLLQLKSSLPFSLFLFVWGLESTTTKSLLRHFHCRGSPLFKSRR